MSVAGIPRSDRSRIKEQDARGIGTFCLLRKCGYKIDHMREYLSHNGHNEPIGTYSSPPRSQNEQTSSSGMLGIQAWRRISVQRSPFSAQHFSTTYRTMIKVSKSVTSPRNPYEGRELPRSIQSPFSNVHGLLSETSQPGWLAIPALCMGHAH